MMLEFAEKGMVDAETALKETDSTDSDLRH